MQGSGTFKSLLHRSLQTKKPNYFFGETHYGCPQSSSSNGDLNCTEYCTQTPLYMRASAPSSPLHESKVYSRSILLSSGIVPEQDTKMPFLRSLCKIKPSESDRFGKKNNGEQNFYLTSSLSSLNPAIDPISKSNVSCTSSLNNAPSTCGTQHCIDFDGAMMINILTMNKVEFDFCTGEPESPKSTSLSSKPSKEQLILAKLKLTETLPEFFMSSSKHPFEMYSQNLIFDNRIIGTKSSGLTKYVSQAVLFKNYTRLKFSSAKFVILGVTIHENDNTIKLRWRIVGIPHKVFQYLSLSKSDSKSEPHDAWYDGYSIFHLGTDGLIHLHEVDMVMHDEERQYMQKLSIGSKIAIALGLVVEPDMSASSISFISNSRRKT